MHAFHVCFQRFPHGLMGSALNGRVGARDIPSLFQVNQLTGMIKTDRTAIERGLEALRDILGGTRHPKVKAITEPMGRANRLSQRLTEN